MPSGESVEDIVVPRSQQSLRNKVKLVLFNFFIECGRPFWEPNSLFLKLE